MAQPEDQPTGAGPEGPLQPEIVTDGEVARRFVDYALRRLRTVIDKVDEPVLFARVKLTESPNPANPRPYRAQVLLDIDGDLVRAQVADETMDRAIDMLKDRLNDQLQHRSERRITRRQRPPRSEPGVWQRGDLPGRRPAFYDRPVAERELVRRKTFAVGELTPEEAVADMEQLDHDFFLFTEAGTGSDALVTRDNGSYRLVRLDPDADSPPPVEGIELAELVPPTLTPEEAVERIGVTGENHLFFRNAETGRGNVLYRRYDGHYGLISPN